jgi:hypothetical protein
MSISPVVVMSLSSPVVILQLVARLSDDLDEILAEDDTTGTTPRSPVCPYGNRGSREPVQTVSPPVAIVGSISPASTFFTLFTLALMGYALIRSAGYSFNSDCSLSLSVAFSLSRRAQASCGRVTGIRSWIGAASSFGSPVMIAHVLIHSAPSRAALSRQFSQKPANANSGSSLGTIA